MGGARLKAADPCRRALSDDPCAGRRGWTAVRRRNGVEGILDHADRPERDDALALFRIVSPSMSHIIGTEPRSRMDLVLGHRVLDLAVDRSRPVRGIPVPRLPPVAAHGMDEFARCRNCA